MKVFIARHAEAKPKIEDPNRSLTSRGREEARLIAGFLSGIDRCSIGTIYHSDKLRAKETAEIFAAVLKPSGGIQGERGLGPGDDPRPWCDRLNAASGDVMLVSHLPFVGDLVTGLVFGGREGGRIAFETASVACTQRTGGGWHLRWLIDPSIAKIP